MKDKLIKKLPNRPGVYFFKKGKEILYIGKATSLRNRVKSYFSKDPEGKSTSYGAGLIETRGPLIVKMVQEANNIDWQETDSVLEALILEANLIKKYQPRYNIKEKDNKSFNYVVITQEKLPRVITVRGRILEKYRGIVFGPFTSGTQLKEALKIVRKIFPYLDDKSKNYLEFYRQINLVPDLGNTKLYKENIKNIKLFFSGKKKEILRNLKKEMKAYAKLREFEKAGELKRQLFVLGHINDIALLKASRENNFAQSLGSKPSSATPSQNYFPTSLRIEAYDIAHMSGKSMVGVMTVVEGQEAEKNQYRKFKIRTQDNANDTGALAEVIERRLKHKEWCYPKLIVVDGSTAQINVVRKILKKAGLGIPVVSVVKDERHRPKALSGDEGFALKYKREILLANSEAHRFAIGFHKKVRGKKFLGK